MCCANSRIEGTNWTIIQSSCRYAGLVLFTISTKEIREFVSLISALPAWPVLIKVQNTNKADRVSGKLGATSKAGAKSRADEEN